MSAPRSHPASAPPLAAQMLAALLLVVCIVACSEQASVEPAEPPPLPEPRVEHLEAAAQQQLTAARNRLAASRFRLAGVELGRAYGELGELYLAYGLRAAAELCLEVAERLDPDDPKWTYYRALTALRAADLQAASAHLERFVARRPDDAPGWVWLSDVHLRLGRLEPAAEAAKRALAIDPASVPARYVLGRVAAHDGRYDAAARWFEEALDIQPSASVIRYPLADAYRRLGREAEAEQQLALRGERRPALGDPLSRRLEEITTGARVHLSRGSTAMRQRNLPLALREFEAAVHAAPDNPTARLNLGAALAQAGRGELAFEHLEAALDLGLDAGNLSKTHFNLGALHRLAGRDEPAAEHLRQALRWDPGNRAARAMLDALEAARPAS